MSVVFRDFQFHNLDGIAVTLRVEAPLGSRIIEVEVGPQGNYEANPNINDVRSVKVTSIADGDHGDFETLTVSGDSQPAFIEAMAVEGHIGSLKGHASIQFGN